MDMAMEIWLVREMEGPFFRTPSLGLQVAMFQSKTSGIIPFPWSLRYDKGLFSLNPQGPGHLSPGEVLASGQSYLVKGALA